MLAKAIVGVDKKKVEFCDVEIGEIGEWDLLVELECSAISVGTESYCLSIMDAASRPKYVAGYAPVGRIVKAGRQAAAAFPEGRRVTYFSPRPPAPCSNTAQMCGGHISPAIINVNPGERDLLGPDTYCVLVPEAVPSEQAAFAGISAVSYLGVKMANPNPNEKIVVIGQGIIGLFATQHFALRGAEVLAADRLPSRLTAAQACGADHVVDTSRDDLAKTVRARWPGGADIVADTTGLYPVIEDSIAAVKRFGKYVFLGWSKGPGFTLEKMQGTRVFEAFFPWTLQGPLVAGSLKLMALGALKVDQLISHRFTPDHAPEVYQFIYDARDQYVGILLDWRKLI